jgi:hypothetical protein
VAGRFPLYTDADVPGPIVAALVRHGWDVARAVDLYAQPCVMRVTPAGAEGRERHGHLLGDRRRVLGRWSVPSARDMGRRRDHEALRERLLARLIQGHALSEDLARNS